VPAAGRGLSDGYGQIAQGDFRLGRHHHPVFDRSAQLTHIPRPVIGQQGVHRVGGEIEQRLVIRLAEMTAGKRAPKAEYPLSARAAAAW
jgi:hypothetical protein